MLNKNHPAWSLLLPCLAAVAVTVYLGWGRPLHRSSGEGSVDASCRIQEGPCTQPFSGGEARLEILPRPVVPMRPLTFRVTISGFFPPSPPMIDLNMPAMDMGPNRVYLKPSGKGLYEGVGVIVKCPSGLTTWAADVTIPEAGEIRFIFDVVQ